MTIQSDVRKGWHDAIVEMFEIDLSTIDEKFTGKYYLTNEVAPDGSAIKWKGQEYTSFPIDASGFEVSTKGQMPQPQITVANVFGTFSAAISTADDLVGAKVTRRRTLAKYLDNGSSPDDTQEFPEDIFYVERKTSETNTSVTWQLSSKIDLEGLMLPRRVITQNHCLWRYRGSECGYTGPPVADEFDDAVGGSSSEARVYSAALKALRRAQAKTRAAAGELSYSKGDKEIVCEIAQLERSGPLFDLKATKGKYTFGIQDGVNYFAAYNDNAVVIVDTFRFFGSSPSSGDTYFGTPQNTGRGPSKNLTGTIWAVNKWIGVPKPPPGSEGVTPPPPDVIVAEIVTEDVYDPPNTFAILDLNDNVLIASSGVIIASGSVSSVAAGGKPSIAASGQTVYARGKVQSFAGVGPVSAIHRWEVSSAACTKATDRLNAAQAAYDTAAAEEVAAKAVYDAALAALPEDDDLYQNDRCGKRLDSCRLRFGTGTLPFGAFPGANLFR